MPILILVVTLGVSWSTLQVFENQKASSIHIDVAGRQRMLSQRLYIELIAGIHRMTEPPEALRYLDQSAKALRFGGRIESPRVADQWEIINKAPSEKIATKLDKQIADIQSLTKLLTEQFKTEESLALVQKISVTADETVQLYVENSQLGVFKILIQNIAFIIVLAVLGLTLSRLIVDRKYKVKELAKAKETAQKASEAKSMFLANMSHEIRTPLNAIIGMTELLQGVKLESEHKRYVETLNRACDTLLNLINDILDLSRIESGLIDLDLSAVDLNELVDQVSQIIALRAHQKGLELLSYITPDVPKYIITDRNRLLQILMNLLSNAVKFTKDGEISLKIELVPNTELPPKNPDEITLKISVTDTGIGIAQEKLVAIFDDFVQADSSVAFNYGGTGLGLAISKKLVSLMHGTISVKSVMGQGSTFTFTIKTTIANDVLSDEKPKDYFHFQGRRILVVDDNNTNRFIVRKYLENLSCHLDEANCGEDALNLLRKAKKENWNYDLILLDYRMPHMNGFEVAQTIKDENLGTSTIVSLLTSDGGQNELAKLPSLGIFNYLIKPIKRNDFLDLLNNAFINLPNKSLSHISTEQVTISKNTSTDNRKFKVLVVDDIIDNRFVVTSHLGHTHFDFDEASDGEQAVNMAHSKNYDLIFMDLRMTPMDGYQATKEIRHWEAQNNFQKQIPIVALTAHALKEEVEKAKLAGCNFHLSKPITKVRLIEMVESILEMKISNELPPVQLKQLSMNSSIESSDLLYVETESFLKPRLAQYVDNRRQDITILTTALAQKEFERIITIGHNVAGTAGIYGMMGLTELSRKLERAAGESNIQEISNLIKEIESYLDRVRF
jgi:signal transduction histidine kinase/CheY-like chemotaxis protein/HPt (histidine-containing phosphotransfer) domain-containing protein